ncbi:MAG: hypothetical protein CO013_10455 [Syntrophobacterales bacterium CG_4_8_14_3_um_filter_58_8]|nr:MAG: hypothetical protein CO013_10455 [Syntrophobacterales bacterium CG_4_8_14_3_um_filter_58_8]
MQILSTGIDEMTADAHVHLRHQGPPEGINFIPAIIGAFAVGEILSKAEEGGGFGEGNVLTKISTKLPSIANLLALKWTMLRSAVIGTFIDILPGVGAVSVPWGDTGIPPDGGGRVCYGRALDRASITSTSCEESWLPPPRPIRALNICATRAVPGSAMPRVWASSITIWMSLSWRRASITGS